MDRSRKRRIPWAIVLLIIALCCAAAYGGAVLINSIRSATSFASTQVLQLNGAQKIEAVGDGLIYYDGSAIAKIGDDAKNRWNYMVGGGADFSATDIGVATWKGRNLTLIDNETGVASYSGNMDEDVLSARIGSEYAAVLVGPEHNSTIVLMETGGRKVDSITLAEQTVIDYGFFYNDTLFWIMTLDTNGTAPCCTVSIYRPGRRLVGSITDSEQLLYSVVFQSSQICVAGDTHLKVYTYNGVEEKEKRKLIYGWTLAAVDAENDNPLMAFTPNGQYDAASVIRDVRLIRGAAEQIVRMPYGCAQLRTIGDRVYGFSGEGYVCIAQMGEQKVSAYQLPIFFDHVYGVTDNNVAVLGSGSTIYLVSLD